MEKNYYRHYNQDLELEYLSILLEKVREHEDYNNIIKHSSFSDKSTKTYLLLAYYLGLIKIEPGSTIRIELTGLGIFFLNSSDGKKKQVFNKIMKIQNKRIIQLIVSGFSVITIFTIVKQLSKKQ